MNKQRRQSLEEIQNKIIKVYGLLIEIRDEEEEYKENIPENLQGSERYEKAEEAVDNLYSALSSLDALEYIETAKE